MNPLRAFVFLVSAVVLLTAGAGLYLSGSPTVNRRLALDTQRLNDLQSITYAMDQFWNLRERLPDTLETLQQTREVYVQNIMDPATKTPYAFRRTDADSYELCATFDLPSPDLEKSDGRYVSYPAGPGNLFWQHPAGEKCFSLDVNKPVKPVTPEPTRLPNP